jgi:hypothetical protein
MDERSTDFTDSRRPIHGRDNDGAGRGARLERQRADRRRWSPLDCELMCIVSPCPQRIAVLLMDTRRGRPRSGTQTQRSQYHGTEKDALGRCSFAPMKMRYSFRRPKGGSSENGGSRPVSRQHHTVSTSDGLPLRCPRGRSTTRGCRDTHFGLPGELLILKGLRCYSVAGVLLGGEVALPLATPVGPPAG